MITQLKQIMSEVLTSKDPLQKCKGVMRSLKFKNIPLHEFIIQKSQEWQIKNTTQTIYLLTHDCLSGVPVCEKCGKERVMWYNYLEGFDKLCGKCVGPIHNKEALIKNWGVDNPAHIPGWKERIGKYDRVNFKEKMHKTLIDKHGSLENFYEQRKEKVEEANLEKFGEIHYQKTQECKDLVKQHLQEKHGPGITNVMHLEEVKIKRVESEKNNYVNYKHNDANKDKIWLEEYKLGEWLKVLFPNNIFIRNEFPPFTNKFRPDYYCSELNMIVEFDGYLHYTDFKVCESDLNKDQIYKERNIQIFHIPYFVQISVDLKNILKSNYTGEIVQVYKHGFIDPNATLPCCYCDLGIKRIIKELEFFKENYVNIYNDIIVSLKNKIIEKKNIFKVVPERLECLVR